MVLYAPRFWKAAYDQAAVYRAAGISHFSTGFRAAPLSPPSNSSSPKAISKGRSVREATSVGRTRAVTAGGNRKGGDPFGLANEAALHGSVAAVSERCPTVPAKSVGIRWPFRALSS